MAKSSFTITTSATEPLKADPKGHAQAVFVVTNATARPVRCIARPKPLGDTKREWLAISGETERDFGAGATEQFTVNFDAVGAPAGKYPFRLDVASAMNPDEDSSEGPTVNVEVAGAAPPPPPGPKPKIWLIILIIAGVLLIAGVILFLVLRNGDKKAEEPTPTPVATETPTATPTPVPSPTPTPTPSESAEVIEKRCFDLVQGRIAWNYGGSNQWSPVNIQNLCRGTSQSDQPPQCFQRVMHGGINSGVPVPISFENNTDRPGNDYNGFRLSSPQFELCRDACGKDPKCTGYSYVNPGVQGPTAVCYLKSPLPAPNPSSCCISGVKTGVGGTQWTWNNALELCKGTDDADKAIGCFQQRIAQGASMQDAIAACNRK
jgi:hypothetical protein